MPAMLLFHLYIITAVTQFLFSIQYYLHASCTFGAMAIRSVPNSQYLPQCIANTNFYITSTSVCDIIIIFYKPNNGQSHKMAKFSQNGPIPKCALKLVQKCHIEAHVNLRARVKILAKCFYRNL